MGSSEPCSFWASLNVLAHINVLDEENESAYLGN